MPTHRQRKVRIALYLAALADGRIHPDIARKPLNEASDLYWEAQSQRDPSFKATATQIFSKNEPKYSSLRTPEEHWFYARKTTAFVKQAPSVPEPKLNRYQRARNAWKRKYASTPILAEPAPSTDVAEAREESTLSAYRPVLRRDLDTLKAVKEFTREIESRQRAAVVRAVEQKRARRHAEEAECAAQIARWDRHIYQEEAA